MLLRFLLPTTKVTNPTHVVKTVERGLKYTVQPLKSSTQNEAKTFKVTSDENTEEALKNIQSSLSKQSFFTKIYNDAKEPPYMLAKRILKDEDVIQGVCNKFADESKISSPKNKC